MPTRSANANWKGGLKGQGDFRGQTGLAGQYSASSRFENGPGSNPEELLAAAEAACFSMALAFALAKAGYEPTSVETSAECSIDKQGEGWKITRDHAAHARCGARTWSRPSSSRSPRRRRKAVPCQPR